MAKVFEGKSVKVFISATKNGKPFDLDPSKVKVSVTSPVVLLKKLTKEELSQYLTGQKIGKAPKGKMILRNRKYDTLITETFFFVNRRSNDSPKKATNFFR